MLFEEIPDDFKTKMGIYLKRLFNNIKKNDNNILYNNVLAPANITTHHMKLVIGNDKHIKLLIEIYYLLHIFHRFSLENEISYSISSGNLLGFYSSGDILLWDDDIDILVDFNHFKIIKKIWDNGGNPIKIWDRNWTYKNIQMDTNSIILCRLQNKDFFKIKINSNVGIKGVDQKDIGGIDIVTPMWTFNQGGIPKPLPSYIRDDISKSKYSIVKYGPVECRIFQKDLAIKLLDIMYPRWRDKKHPLLF